MRTNRRMLTGTGTGPRPGPRPGMPTRERLLPACLARFVLLAALLAAGFTVVAQSPAGATTTSASTVSPLADPPAATPAQLAADAQYEADVNNERAARGIATLTVSPYLQAMAQAYTDYEMSLTAPPWASASPTTLQYDDIGGTFEYNWETANPCTAEQYGVCPGLIYGAIPNGQQAYVYNIGSDEVGGATNIFDSGLGMVALMESVGHRDNLLAAGWTQVGAGSACSATGEQTDILFATTSSSMVAPVVTEEDPIVTSATSGTYPCPPPVSNFAPPGQIVDIASTPSGNGYWTVDSLGYVGAYGAAVNYGGMGGAPLNAPISHIVSTPDGFGYWLVAADGGVFCFGDAQFYGSMGGKPLNAPVMDIVPTSNGAGYWLVATDGGVFSFGNAQFYGSMGGTRLNAPVNGGSFAQGGYRMVANDGGIFDFGGAQFYGSMGGHPLNQPIVGMADTPDGAGYWLVAADGGLFSFGDAQFYGSTGGSPPSTPVVGMAVDDATGGYWIVDQANQVFGFNAPVLPLST